jgi:propionate CoA-transferase
LTQNTQRLVFSGSLTGGDLDIGVKDSQLDIRRDGAFVKFVDKVDQVSFSGVYARKCRKQVTFVTDRAVFELQADGLVLVEIAPGVRLQEDVLAHLAFPVQISPALRLMDERIFRPGPMRLRDRLVAQQLAV